MSVKLSARLDKKIINNIDMSGRGGKEKVFAPALKNYRRVNECLYDFINDSNGERVELKKQKNLQWFDGWKYYNLSNEDRQIVMMFVNHNGTKVLEIQSISLGVMIDTLLSDVEYSESGWDKQVLKNLFDIKQVAKKVQSKLPLKVKDFIKKHPHLFEVDYVISHDEGES